MVDKTVWTERQHFSLNIRVTHWDNHNSILTTDSILTGLRAGGSGDQSPTPQTGVPPLVRCPLLLIQYIRSYPAYCRSQWPRDLRRRSTSARLLRLWVRIPPGAWTFVCCDRCLLSGRGLCDGLITRPEESYWLWRVVVCDQGTSKTRRLKPVTGLWKCNHNGL